MLSRNSGVRVRKGRVGKDVGVPQVVAAGIGKALDQPRANDICPNQVNYFLVAEHRMAKRAMPKRE